MGPKIPKPPTRTKALNQAEMDIDQAVERVYRMYGPDLSVFFNVVQAELQRERHEKQDLSRDRS